MYVFTAGFGGNEMIREMKVEIRQDYKGMFYYQILSDTVGIFSTYEDAERDGNAALNTVVKKFTSNNKQDPCPTCSSWSGYKRAIYCMDCGRKIK
jgi:hypothetical protein